MTPQQSRLIAQAKDNLIAARLLKTNGHYKIAISRAYYAMFYVAKALLLSEGATTSKHAGVMAMFSQLFIKTERIPVEYQRYLTEAQRKRTFSDYDDEIEVLDEDAAEQIDRAEKFIAMGEKFFNSPPTTTSSEPDER